MKKIRLVLPIVAFVMAIGASFASHHNSVLVLDPRANNGSCQQGALVAPPSGTCQRTTNGDFCKVQIADMQYDAYDASCISSNSIRHN
jgi:hypothetical protein